MDEVISCPRCERKLKVPESALGAEVKCPMCDLAFTATPLSRPPAPSGGSPPSRTYQDETPGGRPRRRLDDYDDRDADRPMRPYPRSRYTEAHRGGVVLALGILGLLMFWCCLAGWILGGLAWSMGSTDLQRMQSGFMDPEGQGITKTGQICGIIAMILSTLMACLMLANFRT